jgi:hypothetical protein
LIGFSRGLYPGAALASSGGAVKAVRDLMNPRPSNTLSEDHGRSAAAIPVGSIAREFHEVRESRLN